MITLAAFDMAGTTIEEHGAVYRALADSVRETGATVSQENLQLWMGADKVEAITALIGLGAGTPSDALVAETFDRFRAILAAAYAERPPVPLPGVVEAFAALRARGIRIALTTGFSRDVAEPLLASLGWDESVIDAVVCSDEVAAGRPAPYMIHRAMERTGTLDVREVLVAGDTAVDVRAGLAAGAAITIGVLTGKLERATLETEGPQYVLASVADIPALAELHG